MSRICKACSLHDKLRLSDPVAYDVWKADHNCKINHRGSASGMEVTGATCIFERSIEKNKLRYVEFYGDSKSYPAEGHIHRHYYSKVGMCRSCAKTCRHTLAHVEEKQERPRW